MDSGNVFNILMAILVFAILCGINIFLFLMNKKTPKPEGCENLHPECSGCKDWSCVNHPDHLKEKNNHA